MKPLLDFLPILLFFGAYKLYDIYVATAVLMVATVVQMVIIYATEKRLLTMHKVTLALILGFGAFTLLLHDERFIKIKPTIMHASISIVLAIGLWGFKKNLLSAMLGGMLHLPDRVWRNLTIAWVLFGLFMASLNAFIAYQFSTDQWMNFKLWGFGITIPFFIAQGFYIAKNLPKEDAE
jgi:intracellular septation protein